MADADVAKAEDDRDCKYEVRAKLYKYVDERDKDGNIVKLPDGKHKKELKEMGTGNLRVLYGKDDQEGKRYLLMRDEKLGKIKLNTLLVKNMTFLRTKNNIRFVCPIPEPKTDDKGKIIDHDDVSFVKTMLNIKVNKHDADKTLDAFKKAVPT